MCGCRTCSDRDPRGRAKPEDRGDRGRSADRPHQGRHRDERDAGGGARQHPLRLHGRIRAARHAAGAPRSGAAPHRGVHAADRCRNARQRGGANRVAVGRGDTPARSRARSGGRRATGRDQDALSAADRSGDGSVRSRAQRRGLRHGADDGPPDKRSGWLAGRVCDLRDPHPGLSPAVAAAALGARQRGDRRLRN